MGVGLHTWRPAYARSGSRTGRDRQKFREPPQLARAPPAFRGCPGRLVEAFAANIAAAFIIHL